MDGNILVIDDEPGITMLCDRLLKRAGYEVVSFTDAKKGIDYLEQNPVDLLLVDIRMPKIDGFEVIRSAKQFQPDIAVLVMTGFGTVETAIQALRQGVDGLLLKPFEQGKELVETVHQALIDSENKRDAARIQALRPLFTVSEALISETRQDALLDLIMNSIQDQLDSEHSAVYDYDQQSEQIRLLAGKGIYYDSKQDQKDVELLDRIRSTGKSVLINSIGPGDTRLKNELRRKDLSGALFGCISRKNRSSIFFVGRGIDAPPFREADLEMFLILANQAAVAIENAGLYEELREYVQQIEESQNALLQAEKMAAAGRLTASIAHEVNNPLQALQNCIHLAGRQDLTEEQRAEYFELAKTELDRLKSTVQQMLGFYRPGADSSEEVRVKELLDHVLGLLAQQLEKHAVEVAIDIPSRLPAVVGVSSQIQQVFLNLILNAIDAMQEGGKLVIRGRELKDGVELLFSDTGPGIEDEHRVHIFEPFFSTKAGGTGLGLTVSYNILTTHGGLLELEPGSESGATFRMYIPQGGN
jgi:signal transduction histidine kinase